MYQAAPVTSSDILVKISTSKGYDVVEPSSVGGTAANKKRIDEILSVRMMFFSFFLKYI
jgi:hypothetical protein